MKIDDYYFGRISSVSSYFIRVWYMSYYDCTTAISRLAYSATNKVEKKKLLVLQRALESTSRLSSAFVNVLLEIIIKVQLS